MQLAEKQVVDELTNPVIDTLPLSYAMLPDDQKRFNLGSVCRHYRVSYDGEGAHRADYDADVLLKSCII